jgi:glycosyltransferase involved in cell wall biosynthesis
MSFSNKNILIVNYSSPPYTGKGGAAIGGRRWVIFTSELANRGYNVHVLYKKNKAIEKSVYSSYIENNPNIYLHELPSFYPSILTKEPTSFLSKLYYHFCLKTILLLHKGTPYDVMALSEKVVLRKAKQIIESNNIKNVIVTGAPFSLTYYFAKLKTKLNINLLVDFRDPWAWGGGYGYESINQKRLAFEKMMESSVMDKADQIFVPVEVMAEHLKSTYPNQANKVTVLPHGFDAQNIEVHSREKTINNKPCKLIFIGTLYPGIGGYLEQITKSIADSQIEISIDIYTNSSNYEAIFSKHKILNTKVKYLSSIPPKRLFHIIGNYDFALLIYSEKIKNIVSTKFNEIIYSNIPILYIGEDGECSKYVNANKAGVSILPENIYSSILNAKFAEGYVHNVDGDILKYSYSSITQDLIGFLK